MATLSSPTLDISLASCYGYRMGATVTDVPRRELTEQEIATLAEWQERLAETDARRDQLRRDFAAWVRAIGASRVARALGISRSAMDQRLRALEGKRRKA